MNKIIDKSIDQAFKLADNGIIPENQIPTITNQLITQKVEKSKDSGVPLPSKFNKIITPAVRKQINKLNNKIDNLVAEIRDTVDLKVKTEKTSNLTEGQKKIEIKGLEDDLVRANIELNTLREQRMSLMKEYGQVGKSVPITKGVMSLGGPLEVTDNYGEPQIKNYAKPMNKTHINEFI